MSEEYTRRGRNWLTAMGVLFLVVATVTLVRDIIIWSPDFVFEFFFNSYLEMNYEILDDRQIWYSMEKPFDHTDVTDLIADYLKNSHN